MKPNDILQGYSPFSSQDICDNVYFNILDQQLIKNTSDNANISYFVKERPSDSEKKVNRSNINSKLGDKIKPIITDIESENLELMKSIDPLTRIIETKKNIDKEQARKIQLQGGTIKNDDEGGGYSDFSDDIFENADFNNLDSNIATNPYFDDDDLIGDDLLLAACKVSCF